MQLFLALSAATLFVDMADSNVSSPEPENGLISKESTNLINESIFCLPRF